MVVFEAVDNWLARRLVNCGLHSKVQPPAGIVLLALPDNRTSRFDSLSSERNPASVCRPRTFCCRPFFQRCLCRNSTACNTESRADDSSDRWQSGERGRRFLRRGPVVQPADNSRLHILRSRRSCSRNIGGACCIALAIWTIGARDYRDPQLGCSDAQPGNVPADIVT